MKKIRKFFFYIGSCFLIWLMFVGFWGLVFHAAAEEPKLIWGTFDG